MDVGDAAMGALGSYMQEVQGANKSSRVLESTLKDPSVRSALFPGIDQQQTDAILKYKDTLGAIDGARFLQTAIPMLSKTATGNVEFDRQMQLQRLRNAPAMERIGGGGGGGIDFGSALSSFFKP
jgi:hypothetical protein